MRISDWSSDVCSSDLGVAAAPVAHVEMDHGGARVDRRRRGPPKLLRADRQSGMIRLGSSGPIWRDGNDEMAIGKSGKLFHGLSRAFRWQLKQTNRTRLICETVVAYAIAPV